MEVLVADPDVAQQPLHVFAVKHVSEEHLVACQGFPAGERVRDGALPQWAS